jgi:hypothetical protein
MKEMYNNKKPQIQFDKVSMVFQTQLLEVTGIPENISREEFRRNSEYKSSSLMCNFPTIDLKPAVTVNPHPRNDRMLLHQAGPLMPIDVMKLPLP